MVKVSTLMDQVIQKISQNFSNNTETTIATGAFAYGLINNAKVASQRPSSPTKIILD